MSAMVEVLVRPNGKTYRRRGEVVVDSFVEGWSEETKVVALGTHDESVAYRLACAHWAWLGVGDMALEPWPEPPTWMRKVAFDTGTGYPINFIVDERRGRPALVYSEARMPKRQEASR